MTIYNINAELTLLYEACAIAEQERLYYHRELFDDRGCSSSHMAGLVDSFIDEIEFILRTPEGSCWPNCGGWRKAWVGIGGRDDERIKRDE